MGKLLIDSGADLTIRNKRDKTVLMVAIGKKNKATTESLIDAGDPFTATLSKKLENV